MERDRQVPIVGFVTVAYTILLLIGILTGNDDLGDLWFALFPIFLIFVIFNLLVKKEPANSLSGFCPVYFTIIRHVADNIQCIWRPMGLGRV